MKRILAALLVAFVVVLGVLTRQSAPVAHAGTGDVNPVSQAVDDAYSPDTNFQAFRSALAGADTFTTAAVLATPAFQVGGRTTFYLGTRFTNSAATVSVRLAYVWRNPSATSDTSVTATSISWRNATWPFPNTNTTYTPAANVIKSWGAVQTITAGTVLHEGAYFVPTTGDLFFDTERAITIRVLVTTAPSAGTVSFFCGS